MQYCGKCHIQIRGDKACCPLCRGQLTGEVERGAFPVIPRNKASRMSVLRITLFLVIAFEASMVVLGFILGVIPSWAVLAMLTAAIGLVDVALTLYYRSNALHLVVWEVYIAMGVTFLADVFNGFHRWSICWVAPFMFIGLMVTTVILGKVIGMRTEGYIMYLFFDLVLAFGFQILFILINWGLGFSTFKSVSLSAL